MQVLSPPVSTSAVKFRGLDMLRCCAAMSVVIYHNTLGFHDFLPEAPSKLLHNLPIGVDFFFLISGFLITYLLLTEKERAGTISLGRFYVRRSLRIFPLYYLIILFAWWLHHDANPEVKYGSYLYFCGNYRMIAHGWTVATLNPLWSVCIEEQFYILIPLLVLLLPTRRLPWLFGGIMVLSMAFRGYTAASTGDAWMTLYCHALSRCDVLALGGGLAWYHFTRPLRWHLPRWAVFVVLAGLALLLSFMDTAYFASPLLAVVNKYFYVLPLTFVFCFVLFNNPDRPAASGGFSRVVSYLGKISFGLYLYHSPLGAILDDYPEFYANDPIVRLLVITLLTAGVSMLSYELFEKPILRLKQRFEVVRTVRA